jgi:hypothetical protein
VRSIVFIFLFAILVIVFKAFYLDAELENDKIERNISVNEIEQNFVENKTINQSLVKRQNQHPDISKFSCDNRIHCSQMRSCEEAIFFIKNCSGTKMDGDRDGIPCESELCGY